MSESKWWELTAEKPKSNLHTEQKEEAMPWWEFNARAEKRLKKQTEHKKYLWEQQLANDPFPKSNKNIPVKRTDAEYSSLAISPYQHIIESDKTDFINSYAGVGHKVHLNVEPKQVQKVSEYLKTNQYAHKYLSGGEVADGTIFTVYFGSLVKAKQWCDVIAKDLDGMLQRPLMNYEVEYAPNISGRFVGGKKDFSQYPLASTRGLGSLFDLVKNDLWTQRTPDESKKHLMEVFQKSYQRLAKEYGPFFYGE